MTKKARKPDRSNERREQPRLNRRQFATMASGAVAGAGMLGAAGCDSPLVQELLQEHFREMSKEELQEVIARIEKECREKFGKDPKVETTPAMTGVLFGYALDISRCIGCRRCVYACVQENNQSRDPEIQWIRVLELNKEHGIDLPESDPYYCSSDSVHDRELEHASGHEKKPRHETKEKAYKRLTESQKKILEDQRTQYPLYKTFAAEGEGEGEGECEVPRKGHFYLPVQCQQCRHPACVKTCPVGATWQDPDGIVVIDYNWCIGCRCCMAACPYGARHFNWGAPNIPKEDFNPKMHFLGNRPRRAGTVEKCSFCIQRTREGLYPACVEICPVGARKFGNLLDPNSEIRYVLDNKRVYVLKNELNTRPKFYYFYGT